MGSSARRGSGGDPEARQAVAQGVDHASTAARSSGQLRLSGDRAAASPPPEGQPPGDWSAGQHRVVVIGGGFAGLRAVRELRRAGVEVTLLDRRNFHLLQPLLYQVASGALSPGEIAYPLRGIFARQPNARVLMAEVAAIDLPGRSVRL